VLFECLGNRRWWCFGAAGDGFGEFLVHASEVVLVEVMKVSVLSSRGQI
jgi:hypothetical protein